MGVVTERVETGLPSEALAEDGGFGITDVRLFGREGDLIGAVYLMAGLAVTAGDACGCKLAANSLSDKAAAGCKVSSPETSALPSSTVEGLGVVSWLVDEGVVLNRAKKLPAGWSILPRSKVEEKSVMADNLSFVDRATDCPASITRPDKREINEAGEAGLRKSKADLKGARSWEKREGEGGAARSTVSPATSPPKPWRRGATRGVIAAICATLSARLKDCFAMPAMAE